MPIGINHDADAPVPRRRHCMRAVGLYFTVSIEFLDASVSRSSILIA